MVPGHSPVSGHPGSTRCRRGTPHQGQDWLGVNSCYRSARPRSCGELTSDVARRRAHLSRTPAPKPQRPITSSSQLPVGGPAGRNMASTLKMAVKAPTTIPTLTHRAPAKRPLRPVITAPLAPSLYHDMSVPTMTGTREAVSIADRQPGTVRRDQQKTAQPEIWSKADGSVMREAGPGLGTMNASSTPVDLRSGGL